MTVDCGLLAERCFDYRGDSDPCLGNYENTDCGDIPSSEESSCREPRVALRIVDQSIYPAVYHTDRSGSRRLVSFSSLYDHIILSPTSNLPQSLAAPCCYPFS